MRKTLIAAAMVVSLGAAALVIPPGVGAQVRDRIVRPGIDPFLLEGSGSEIGVSVRDLRRDEASPAKPNGVFVQDVAVGGPASRAGVRNGDVVVEFDGERVRSVRQFARLVRETRHGRTVRTVVVRDGVRQTLARVGSPA